MKHCDLCQKEIPLDFVNLLCIDCYNRQTRENELKKKEEEEARKEMPKNIQTETNSSDVDKISPLVEAVNGITDPNYTENPEMEDKEQVMANLVLFQKHGFLIWHPTRTMYEFIKNYCITKATSHPQYPKFIWKPTIVDVGCGCGVGSNILSQEADFVWGIDKNESSVKFAQEAFTRVKNGIYYNSQVTFDQFDLIKDGRETQKFDVVVAIEVIEHVYDYKAFLKNLTRFDNSSAENPTEYFISTPNRANKHIQKDKPYNKYHVREYTGTEFHAVLSEFFKDIKFFSSAGEPAEIDTNHTPVLAQMKKK